MSSRKAGRAAAVAVVLVGLLVVAVVVVTGRATSGSDLTNQDFTASNGLTGRFHLFGDGIPTDRPVGLLVQFHGDGAFEFEHPRSDYSLGGPDGIVAKAREHGLLVVAALSPDRRGEVTWWEGGRRNADYAADLLRYVTSDRYEIDPGNIWLVGYSGGAQFITQFFLPRYSRLIDGGGSVVFGGGARPVGSPEPFAPSLKSRFPMHWYTGADDDGRDDPEGYDALDDAEQGSAWYGREGFDVELESPDGVGHDDLPFGEVVGEQLDEHPPGATAGEPGD
jgi:poly(3-hydroxybutyrate) depolymerase